MSERWSKLAIFVTAMVLVLVAAGCSPSQQGTEKAGHDQHASGSYPVTVTDQTGQKVTLKKEPKRIVSLMPHMTEIAYALGEGNHVVGVTTNDDYPKQVKKLPKVGDMNINAEKVVELKPDLVLASPNNDPKTIDKLRKLGLPVLVYEGTNLKEVFQSIETVGQAVHAEKKADQVIAEMKKEQKEAQQVAKSVADNQMAKVWLEVSPDLFTGGKGTFMDELITLAGGKNVAGNIQGWKQVSGEKVVQWNPDVILMTHPDEKEVKKRSGWKNIDAVKKNRVHVLDTNLVSRPGPRITDGLLEISKALYPKEFKKAME
jgi:iron complex transport system substrate-binding protein